MLALGPSASDQYMHEQKREGIHEPGDRQSQGESNMQSREELQHRYSLLFPQEGHGLIQVNLKRLQGQDSAVHETQHARLPQADA